MTLIQGTVEYTTPRPFESASARVTLSFAFVEGFDEGGQIRHVARIAELQAKLMIGGIAAEADDPSAPISDVAAVPQEAAAPAPSPASNVVQLPGASMTTVLPTAETPVAMAGLPGGSPATPASSTPVAIASSATEAPVSVAGPGISDTDLVTAITHRNAALLPVYGEGSAQKICDLVAEFVQPPAKAYAIPAAQRQAFLDRLKELV